MEIKIDNKSVEQLVQTQIRLAVAESLSKQTPYLVERLVMECLNQKSPNYPYQPVLESMTQKMINEAANEAAQQWLDEQKPIIRKLVFEKLSSKSKGLIAQVADALTAKLGTGLGATVWLKNERE